MKRNRTPERNPDEWVEVYSSSITLRDGRKIWAKDYGKKVFRFWARRQKG